MTKAEELARPDGCLGKAADDEPIFVLRAKDLLAPEAVRAWCGLLVDAWGGNWMCLPRQIRAKLTEALELADAMTVWSAEQSHDARMPD